MERKEWNEKILVKRKEVYKQFGQKEGKSKPLGKSSTQVSVYIVEVFKLKKKAEGRKEGTGKYTYLRYTVFYIHCFQILT